MSEGGTERSGLFNCDDCDNAIEAEEGQLGCDRCGKCFEGVRNGDTLEIWDAEGVIDAFERETAVECQFCGVFHDTAEEHEEHVEEQHYSELYTDGGIETSSVLFDRWIGKADENIAKWGLQDEETLLLAIQEELGELTQAHLEARAEGGDPARIDEELDDLGALLLQFHEARNGRPVDTETNQSESTEEEDRA